MLRRLWHGLGAAPPLAATATTIATARLLLLWLLLLLLIPRPSPFPHQRAAQLPQPVAHGKAVALGLLLRLLCALLGSGSAVAVWQLITQINYASIPITHCCPCCGRSACCAALEPLARLRRCPTTALPCRHSCRCRAGCAIEVRLDLHGWGVCG